MIPEVNLESIDLVWTVRLLVTSTFIKPNISTYLLYVTSRIIIYAQGVLVFFLDGFYLFSFKFIHVCVLSNFNIMHRRFWRIFSLSIWVSNTIVFTLSRSFIRQLFSNEIETIKNISKKTIQLFWNLYRISYLKYFIRVIVKTHLKKGKKSKG